MSTKQLVMPTNKQMYRAVQAVFQQFPNDQLSENTLHYWVVRELRSKLKLCYVNLKFVLRVAVYLQRINNLFPLRRNVG